MKQKSTSKNKQKLSKRHNVTVIFGYSLFSLIVLGALLWTVIPHINALFYPTSRYLNIIVLLITLVAAAVLPVLGSYILGDRATHVKNKVLHRYNGVLFGIAAYWVALALGFIGPSQFLSIGQLPVPFSAAYSIGLPVLLSIAVMVFIAIGYAMKQSNHSSVLEYRPFQFVLVGSVIAFYVIFAMNGFFDFKYIDPLWTGIAAIALPIVLTAISYKVLAKYHTSRFTRLTDAVVAMSFAYITLSAIPTFISSTNVNWLVALIWSYILALGVWVAYLYLRSRND